MDAQALGPITLGLMKNPNMADYLADADPVLRQVIVTNSDFDADFEGRGQVDGFETLARSIISQQLSTSAARSIRGRVEDLAGKAGLTPEAVRPMAEDAMREAGLSRAKVAYLKGIAEEILTGHLDLEGLDRLSDDDALSRLQAVRGIGLWTAQMYVIFKLQRPDIFPIGDAGIRRAMTLLYSPDLPVDDDWFLAVSDPWKPHRSTASRYLWNALDSDVLSRGKETAAQD